MSAYCDISRGHPVHGPHHDTEYGFPVSDDNVLFERLCLEIFQAGLNWELVLKKRAGMNEAFDGFDVEKVAVYGEKDKARLKEDARIIRNRLKIESIVDNAGRVLRLREQHGSFAGWLDDHHPLTLKEWTRLFRKTFRFTGYLPGAHREDCPVYAEIARLEPPWMRARA
jgi:DNA-3-methyladenine glycosylase I